MPEGLVRVRGPDAKPTANEKTVTKTASTNEGVTLENKPDLGGTKKNSKTELGGGCTKKTQAETRGETKKKKGVRGGGGAQTVACWHSKQKKKQKKNLGGQGGEK